MRTKGRGVWWSGLSSEEESIVGDRGSGVLGGGERFDGASGSVVVGGGGRVAGEEEVVLLEERVDDSSKGQHTPMPPMLEKGEKVG